MRSILAFRLFFAVELFAALLGDCFQIHLFPHGVNRVQMIALFAVGSVLIAECADACATAVAAARKWRQKGR